MSAPKGWGRKSDAATGWDGRLPVLKDPRWDGRDRTGWDDRPPIAWMDWVEFAAVSGLVWAVIMANLPGVG